MKAEDLLSFPDTPFSWSERMRIRFFGMSARDRQRLREHETERHRRNQAFSEGTWQKVDRARASFTRSRAILECIKTGKSLKVTEEPEEEDKDPPVDRRSFAFVGGGRDNYVRGYSLMALTEAGTLEPWQGDSPLAGALRLGGRAIGSVTWSVETVGKTDGVLSWNVGAESGSIPLPGNPPPVRPLRTELPYRVEMGWARVAYVGFLDRDGVEIGNRLYRWSQGQISRPKNAKTLVMVDHHDRIVSSRCARFPWYRFRASSAHFLFCGHNHPHEPRSGLVRTIRREGYVTVEGASTWDSISPGLIYHTVHTDPDQPTEVRVNGRIYRYGPGIKSVVVRGRQVHVCR